MSINFDSVQSTTSATVTTSPNNELVQVQFARILDQDVLTDMQQLKTQPSVRFFSMYSNQQVFDIVVGSNYQLEVVAEAIAQMIEGHGLSVGRQMGLNDKKPTNSFTKQ